MAEPDDGPEFESLLEFLRDHRGFDFTGYKRPTLLRRVNRRMSDVGIETYEDYLDHLQVHPDEFTHLFDTILINVTQFFRDPDAWAALREHVIPEIVRERDGSSQPIRVWTPACSSGQEAYTVAMILAETLGEDEFMARVKIYGTDVDEADLDVARRGEYTDRDLEGLATELRERYFEPIDGVHVFRKDLRRSVIFGRHDLLQDAPIGRLDLLTCRNTLMYFNADVQREILRRFHFALRPDGFLFLGEAESLLTQNELFEPVVLRHRIFRKVPTEGRHHRILQAPALVPNGNDHGDGARTEVMVSAFGATPVPQLVVSDGRFLVAANDAARDLFGIRPADLGRPFHDLQVSYRPADLRTIIDEVLDQRQRQQLTSVRWGEDDNRRWFDIDAVPLTGPQNRLLGASLVFRDISQAKEAEQELQTTANELETAYEELQSTNEELETTNEELQSTIEELETTNEELQSSNEELETMNEELQSTNAELEAMNEQLIERGEELDEANAYLRSILRSLRSAAVVMDRELVVKFWNDHATELWGLRSDEVADTHFLNLEIGLPVATLREPMLEAIGRGDAEADPSDDLVVEARDRIGRPVRCSITCSPLLDEDGETRGVILLMDTEVIDEE